MSVNICFFFLSLHPSKLRVKLRILTFIHDNKIIGFFDKDYFVDDDKQIKLLILLIGAQEILNIFKLISLQKLNSK